MPTATCLTSTNPEDQVTTWEYDALNRHVARTDAIGGRWTTAFDAAGQAVVVVDAPGTVHTQPVRRSRPNGT